MRIGLLTYHHVVNAGSVLQAYCGYHLLQSVFPDADIEIIDYVPEASQRYNDQTHAGSGLQEEMAKFLTKHCRFSPFRLRSDDEAVASRAIRDRGYDMIWTGSDTVFQVDGYLGRLIAGPPAPNLYYLPGPLSPRKIGLSVSFDPPQKVDRELASKLGALLEDFSFVFFRDSHAEKTLFDLGVSEQKMAFLPDPTVMFDIQGLIPHDSSGRLDTPRTVGVSISNARIRETAIRFAESRGYRVVDMMQPPPPEAGSGRKWFRRNSPVSFLERLSVYRRLSGLITDRFHGSLFAMQLGDYPVVGIEFSGNYPDGHGKLWDLNQRLERGSTVIRSDGGHVSSTALAEAWEESAGLPLHTRSQLALLRAEGFRNLQAARSTGLFPT